jgi:DNA mismatch endonuclease, patch repair protein
MLIINQSVSFTKSSRLEYESMPDMYSPEKRSEIMSRIRAKETQAEKIAFQYLRQQKIYFQKHYARAAGKPDIALPRKKKVVFIDGDFWHGKTYDKVLQNRPPGDYWVLKIAGNMERDKQQRKALADAGWDILQIWEEDIKRKSTRDQTLESIKTFLTS